MFVCPTRLKCVHLFCVAEFLFLLLQKIVGQKLCPTFCLARTVACWASQDSKWNTPFHLAHQQCPTQEAALLKVGSQHYLWLLLHIMGLCLEMPACSDPSVQSHTNAIDTLDCIDSIRRVGKLNTAGTFFSGNTQSALLFFFLVPACTFYLQLGRWNLWEELHSDLEDSVFSCLVWPQWLLRYLQVKVKYCQCKTRWNSTPDPDMV